MNEINVEQFNSHVENAHIIFHAESELRRNIDELTTAYRKACEEQGIDFRLSIQSEFYYMNILGQKETLKSLILVGVPYELALFRSYFPVIARAHALFSVYEENFFVEPSLKSLVEEIMVRTDSNDDMFAFMMSMFDETYNLISMFAEHVLANNILASREKGSYFYLIEAMLEALNEWNKKEKIDD